MSKTIKRNCEYCNKEFDAAVKEVNRGNARYCSRSCVAKNAGKISAEKAKKKRVDLICDWCNKKFSRKKSSLPNSKSGLYFCCRACKDMAQRLGGLKKIMPDHYGKAYNIKRERGRRFGSRVTLLRIRENICVICGYSKCVHALHIHHKDRNPLNHKLENLEIVCRNCHAEIHYCKGDC